MAGEDGREEKPLKLKDIWRRSVKEIVVGAVVAVGFIAGGAWLFGRYIAHKNPPAPPREAAVVATINLHEVMMAHKDYDKLRELRYNYAQLKAEAAAGEGRPPITVKPPEVDSKPFDDSVWQKNAQVIIGRRAEIERELKAVEDKKREELRPAYEEERDSINGEYLNAILNIRLKLDNAKAMRLTEEQVTALEEELERLQLERGDKQAALAKRYDEEVAAFVQQLSDERLAELKTYAQQSMEAMKADALKKQAEAQARDTAAMEASMNLSLERQRLQALRENIISTQQAIFALEDHILNDVADKAADLAIRHHYLLVLSSPAPRADTLKPYSSRLDEDGDYAIVIGVDTDDLTPELLLEMDDE